MTNQTGEQSNLDYTVDPSGWLTPAGLSYPEALKQSNLRLLAQRQRLADGIGADAPTNEALTRAVRGVINSALARKLGLVVAERDDSVEAHQQLVVCHHEIWGDLDHLPPAPSPVRVPKPPVEPEPEFGQESDPDDPNRTFPATPLGTIQRSARGGTGER